MKNLICHIAPLGLNSDWIKQGLLFYDWNFLIIVITEKEEFSKLANNLKDDLIPSYTISDQRKLDEKLIKKVEILTIKSRNTLEFIKAIKKKLTEVKEKGYKIYFNATSGLELWKFAAYFISATENLIDKFYYIPKDSDLKEPIKPLEIYLPMPLSDPLKRLLVLLNTQKISQKNLVKETGLSKGMVSRYLRNLINLNLIKVSRKKSGKERFFEITEKGKWYL